MVLPARGLACLGTGCLQAEQPLLGKEGVGPLDLIEPAGEAASPVALAQDGPQPPSYPCIERREGRGTAVLEVLEPSPQRAVHILDDRVQTVPRRSPGLGADRILELPEALVSRPALAGREAIAEELKALSACIDQSGLGRVQRQSG